MHRNFTRLLLRVAMAAMGLSLTSNLSGVFASGAFFSPVTPAAAQEVDTSGIVDMRLGSVTAPVTVVAYLSFTDPGSKTFYEQVFPAIKENYIETGRVEFVYREAYFDRFGLWASLVARCGGQERFFETTKLLHAQQSGWTAGGDPVHIAQSLRRIGLTSGFTNAQLDACLSDAEKAMALVAWWEQNAVEYGVRSTPSFVIDDATYANMNFAEMAAVLDGLLAN